MKPSVSYDEFMGEMLKDRDFAAEYLSAAIREEEPELLLLALRNVANAQGGMKKLALKAKLNRESLYKMLSKRGNPGIYNLQAVFNALGFQICVQDKFKKTKLRKAS